jgi:SOS response regulatory protein OraA/RecX
MREFWKNEWKLFEEEFDSALGFLMQPVSFSSKTDKKLALKPTSKEIFEKADEPGFWKREWQLFEQEYDSALDFLMQPVTFSSKTDKKLALKPTYEEISEKADEAGFWKKEWQLFEQEVDSVVDFLMQPVDFK